MEQLWSEAALYSQEQSAPAINELQWIQYQLDNFSSIDEVISNLGRLRIQKAAANIHYFTCDASGKCAAIEAVNGELSAYAGDSLRINALTNSTYPKSLEYLKALQPETACTDALRSESSEDRFVKASCSTRRDTRGVGELNRAFSMLDEVKQQELTKWSIVYETDKRIVHFKTTQASSVKAIDLSLINFSCGSIKPSLDINFSGGGDVTRLMTNYTEETNKALVVEGNRFAKLPEKLIDVLAHFPDTFTCKSSE